MKKLLLGLIFFVTACTVTEATKPPATAEQPNPLIEIRIPVPGGAQAVEKWLQSVVKIYEGNGSGSGFFIKNNHNNFVVTAAQVRTYDRNIYTVTNSVASETTDAAIVYIDAVADNPGLPVDCRHVEFQEDLYIIGHPYGINQVVITTGKVASPLKIQHPQIPGITGVLIDARVSPGNSGGPVLDRDGEVVGILVARVPDGGVAIMVPINDVCEELKLNGK